MKSPGSTRRRAGNTEGLESGGGQEYFRGRSKMLWLAAKTCKQAYSPVILKGLPVAKAPDQNASDSERRRLGEQIGLDTRVALAVNYADCGVAAALSRCSAVA